jgi:hypothetical protein
VPRRFRRWDTYRFSCSVNLNSGQVRTAHIDQFPVNAYNRSPIQASGPTTCMAASLLSPWRPFGQHSEGRTKHIEIGTN